MMSWSHPSCRLHEWERRTPPTSSKCSGLSTCVFADVIFFFLLMATYLGMTEGLFLVRQRSSDYSLSVVSWPSTSDSFRVALSARAQPLCISL